MMWTESKNLTEKRQNSYLYLLTWKKLDQYKYESILEGLNNFVLGNDQYPLKPISETNNVLNNHRFDNTKSNNDRKDFEKEKEEIPAIKEEESPTISFA